MAIQEYLRRVFPGSAEDFCQKAGKALQEGDKLFVVTANPEILMKAEGNAEIRRLLLDEETAVVPDGISVVRAMQQLFLPATERITGVDLAQRLLDMAGQAGKRGYLLGATEGGGFALAKKPEPRSPRMGGAE